MEKVKVMRFKNRRNAHLNQSNFHFFLNYEFKGNRHDPRDRETHPAPLRVKLRDLLHVAIRLATSNPDNCCVLFLVSLSTGHAAISCDIRVTQSIHSMTFRWKTCTCFNETTENRYVMLNAKKE